MKIIRRAAALALLLALALTGAAGCGKLASPVPGGTAQPAAQVSPPAVPASLDPTGVGCATMRLLDVSGTAEQYKLAAATLMGSSHKELADAAAKLLDAATASNVGERSGRATLLARALDVDDWCIRFTGVQPTRPS